MPSRYASGHGPTLRSVLHRLDLWPAADRSLPEPEELRRGVAGRSAVYLVYLPAPAGGGRYIAAKFDEPARSRREWRAVAQLRTLDAPPEILLPLPGNLPTDGVMVFQAAEAVAGTLRCVTLLNYLSRQIATNPANCRTALTRTFEVLGAYYDIQPGAHRLETGHGLLRWRDVYGDALRATTVRAIQETAAQHWPGVDWETASEFPLAAGRGAHRQLPNPLRRLPELLDAPTGRIMLSRIHGDLNLTNVIVGERADGAVDRVLVFDLANCEPDRAQAVDFARLEAEIWRHIPNAGEPPVTEDELVAARDALDGRTVASLADLSATARGCVLVVDHLRELARSRLAPRLPSAYLLGDHFHALCLTALATLKHPDVATSRSSSRAILLAAALSLLFLDEVKRGLYSSGSVVHHWPPPRRFASPVAIDAHGASPAREPLAAKVLLASRRAREALDPYILERIMRPALVEKYLGAIARGLEGENSRLIPLVGPAGFGKSTLLGTLYDRLTSSAAGWCALVRCNDLDQTESGGLSRSLGHALAGEATPIEDIAAALSTERGRGVLLLDTLDLILARETLPALRTLFTALLDRRVTVFLTCRDYEYGTLIEPVRDSLPGLAEAVDRHQLPGFSASEVEEATRSFFTSRDGFNVLDGGHAFARRVLELAADGRPMAEITRNPLLLALLCELFGREQHVPADLTVSRLYDTFWSRKVAASRLFGHNTAETFAKQEICQRLARHLALTTDTGFRDSMFTSDLHVAATPAGPAALADLLSEGVLRRMASERVGFFHQTFQEYTAARWLATHDGEPDRRAFLDRLGDEYLVSHPHVWAILRQLLAISDDAEFSRLLADLDLGDLSSFRALALAAAARDDGGNALRGLIAAGLPLGRHHQRILQEAVDSSPPGNLAATWDLLLTLIVEADWPVAVNAVRTLGRLVARRGPSFAPRLSGAIATILRRPESKTGSHKDLLGWICAAFAEDPAHAVQPQILAALREVLASLGHRSQVAVVRLHLREGVPLPDQLTLFTLVSSRPVPEDGTEVLVELTLRLLPALLGPAPSGRWSDLFTLLNAELPEGWSKVQANVVGHGFRLHGGLVALVLDQLFSGTGSKVYRAQLALRAAIRTGGTAIVRSALLAIPASSLPPERARRLAGVLADLAAHTDSSADRELLIWLEPVVLQDPENFVKSLAALAEGTQAASELVARLLAGMADSDRMRLIRAVLRHGRRETALLLAERLEHELAAAPADRGTRLALVSTYRVLAARSPQALRQLLQIAGSENQTAALAASEALIDVALEGSEFDAASLVALLHSHFQGVRHHALQALRVLLRRLSGALSDADLLGCLQALEMETEAQVVLALSDLLGDWLRDGGRLTPDLVESFLRLAGRLLAAGRLGSGLARTLIILLKVMAQTAAAEIAIRLQPATLAILRSADLHLVQDGESEMLDLLGALARADPQFLPRVVADPPSHVRNLRALVFAIKRVEGPGSALFVRLASHASCPSEVKQLLLTIRTG